MRTTWSFACAGQLVFGRGAAQLAGAHAARRRFRRAFVISDRALQTAGLVEPIAKSLVNGGVEVGAFLDGAAEPAVDVAVQAAEAARAFQPDVLVGLGGGSNLDLAKVVAILLAHGGSPADYFGYDRVPGPVTPLIAIPTTAGTGSEVSHAAVLTDTANAVKVSTLSPYLRPALALVDPLLTLSCPRKVTADSGIDALTHAIEACTAVDADKLELAPGETSPYEGRYLLGNALAEQAVRLIGKHLQNAVHDPQNLAAREGMSLAAVLAGMSFSNCGVALVHALEYPLGGAVHVTHGAGNGLLLPHVMRFNLSVRAETMAEIAGWLGVDVTGMSVEPAAETAIAAVEQLQRAIGIPQRIRDLGVRESQLPELAAKAFGIQRLRKINPRPATEADLLGILRAAY